VANKPGSSGHAHLGRHAPPFTYPIATKSGTDSLSAAQPAHGQEHLPLVSEPFQAVQGLNAIAVMETVFDRNHQFVGSFERPAGF